MFNNVMIGFLYFNVLSPNVLNVRRDENSFSLSEI